MKRNVISSFVWKALERVGNIGIQFLIQIVLARIIDPSKFGVLTIMAAFTSLVQVFSQNGLNMALVQNQSVTEDDYSSVFYTNLAIMSGFYFLAVLFAPIIERFYGYENFVAPFRVLAITFFLTAFSSVQVAKLTKEMQFKKIFGCSIIGVLFSGVIGIVMAYKGYELWALVIQQVVNQGLNMICLCFVAHWRPRPVFSLQRVKTLFRVGGKMLAGSLINALYNDIYSFAIGKIMAADVLAFYKRGKNFPMTASSIVTATTQSVMLPFLAEKQDDRKDMLASLREVMRFSTYIAAPIMLGLLSVAQPLVAVLLTEKWLPAVPYLQIFCVSFLLIQIHAVFTQALNAKGRSDLTLIVQILLTFVNLGFCFIALLVFRSTLLFAWGSLIVDIVVILPLDMYYCKRELGYRLADQLRDILLNMAPGWMMLGVVCLIGLWRAPMLLLLIVQILAGVTSFILFSALLRLPTYQYLMGKARLFLKKR